MFGHFTPFPSLLCLLHFEASEINHVHRPQFWQIILLHNHIHLSVLAPVISSGGWASAVHTPYYPLR